MWAAEEIQALLPDPVDGATEGTTLGDVFMHHYGVKDTGNVDPRKVRACGNGKVSPMHAGSIPLHPGGAYRKGLSFQDPHQELKGKNVLIVRGSPELTASRFGLEPQRLGAVLQEGRQRLAAARAQRPRPHLDSKMLAAWNGERWLRAAGASTLLGACSNEA